MCVLVYVCNMGEQLAFRSAQSLLALKKDHMRRILHIPPPPTPGSPQQCPVDPVAVELERSVAIYLRKTVDKFDLTKSVEVRIIIIYFQALVETSYLGPRGMRMGSGEGSTMRNFIVCTVHLI